MIARLFVPGHYLPGPGAPAHGVVAHVLAVSDTDVTICLADAIERFGDRHRDLTRTFVDHAAGIVAHLDDEVVLSDERLLLLGATFTHEYSVQAAALCNPSVVAHPDQSDVADGALRFVMSVRQVGEGHRSSIGFRTGVVQGDGQVAVDEVGPYTTTLDTVPSGLDADVFRALAAVGDEAVTQASEADRNLWTKLAGASTVADVDEALTLLVDQDDTGGEDDVPGHGGVGSVERLRALSGRFYATVAPKPSPLSERVLYPAAAVESNGMEDARFVRFVDDDATVTYYATYTGFDGRTVSQQLLSTTDFSTFEASPLVGPAASDKGMALFPRRIGGRFAALSRHDRASISIAFSDDIRHWPTATRLVCPRMAWEAVQIGNCGPPIETDAGWLVITHGVGPMRTYSLGAWLLDLHDPTRIIGRLCEPLLVPLPAEQDGYVPNVVYSCGALVHAGTLIVPYGIADAAIGFASIAVSDLLAALEPPSHVPAAALTSSTT